MQYDDLPHAHIVQCTFYAVTFWALCWQIILIHFTMEIVIFWFILHVLLDLEFKVRIVHTF